MIFVFNIEPVPMARPRFNPRSRFHKAFIPKKQHDYDLSIKSLASEQYHGELISKTPLVVEMEFYRPMPKSMSKNKMLKAIKKLLLPITKPDVDNYIKLLLDACTGVIWKDDNEIVKVIGTKFYSDKPHIVMKVNEFEE